MTKKAHYLPLLLILTVLTGCCTVKGMQQDAKNMTNPDENGWNALKKADAWMQENMW